MYFHFREFSVNQTNTPMKIGTDGVLLGAWITDSGKQALDIGTGTGLIAIMLAQKISDMVIDAIEPHDAAYLEACENFTNSPWNSRLHCHHITLQNYSPSRKYDLIVSNPPFFKAAVASPESGRAQARQASYLPPEDLLLHTDRMLLPEGSFQVILPENMAQAFILTAGQHHLFLKKQTLVYPDEHKPVNRRLMEFSRHRQDVSMSELYIRENNAYSEDYLRITRDYYL